MNLADSEIVKGILISEGFQITEKLEEAKIVLINTCSVRDHAEERIIGRISNLKRARQKGLLVGLLGCMAERLNNRLLQGQNAVELVVGPDEYRRLPEYIRAALTGARSAGISLSLTETYNDISPVRIGKVSAWIPIMRGCNNFCSYCVVPYTRGRERSRNFDSIIEEVKSLGKEGIKEISFLGQNVNSYNFSGKDFPDLLEEAADACRNIRMRFMTSHPKDMSEKLLRVIASKENLCSSVHLPFQSGSNRILGLMNRKYGIEHYLSLIETARKLIPGASFSTDIISGFPTETEEDHRGTMDVLEKVRFDGAFMFKYSPREGTKAFSMKDDVPEELKSRRLSEIIDLQNRISGEINSDLRGSSQTVLVEGYSRKSNKFLCGRTESNKLTVFPAQDGILKGDFVRVKITGSTSATLKAEISNE